MGPFVFLRSFFVMAQASAFSDRSPASLRRIAPQGRPPDSERFLTMRHHFRAALNV
jgi:hypothetical protein